MSWRRCWGYRYEGGEGGATLPFCYLDTSNTYDRSVSKIFYRAGSDLVNHGLSLCMITLSIMVHP